MSERGYGGIYAQHKRRALQRQSMVEFLLARLAEEDKRARDEYVLKGIPEDEWAEALPFMSRTMIYKHMEVGAALRQLLWRPIFAISPQSARNLAATYADHPDYCHDWRP